MAISLNMSVARLFNITKTEVVAFEDSSRECFCLIGGSASGLDSSRGAPRAVRVSVAITLRKILALVISNDTESSSPVVSEGSVVSSTLVLHVHLRLHFLASMRMVTTMMRSSAMMWASMVRSAPAMARSLVLHLLGGNLTVGIETKELLVLFLGPVTHEVHGDLVTIGVLLSVLLDKLHFLGEDGESVFVLLLGAIGFSVLGKIRDVFSLNLSLDLEELGA
jgi:hypothetical protein